MKTSRRALVVAAMSLAAAASARAGTTSVNFESSADQSVKKLGSFSGSASYDNVTGLLTINLTNTSGAKAGKLTGFAFNVTGDGVAHYLDGDVAGTRADEDAFDDARSKKGVVKAKPFGSFEAGSAVNGKWNVGGKAARLGVGAGETRTFTFAVDNGAALTAADFFAGNTGIVAAFRGKKADKVGGLLLAGNNPNTGGDTGTPPINIDVPPLIVPPPVPPVDTAGGDIGIGGGNTGGSPGTAVPLPPAAIPALATFGLLGFRKVKRKLREML